MIAFVGDDDVQYSADEEEDEEDNELNATNNGSEQEDDRSQRSYEDQYLARPLASSQPSLTPTPPTPIEDIRVATAASVISHQTAAQQSTASTITICDAYEPDPGHQIGEGQGPALVCSLTKTTNAEESDAEGLGEEVNGGQELSGQRSHTTADDYNPESEYFSDPDFHDERPGKKSLVELEEERRLRRERRKRRAQFRVGAVSSSGSSADNAAEQVQQVAAEGSRGISVGCVENDAVIEQQDETQHEDEKEDSRPISEQIEENNFPRQVLGRVELGGCENFAPKVSIESSEPHETLVTIESNYDDDDDEGTSQDTISLGNFVSEKVAIEDPSTALSTNCAANQVVVSEEAYLRVESEASSSTIHSATSVEPDKVAHTSSDTSGEADPLQGVSGDDTRIEQLAESVECPVVTASEANAELFVDESTLAEDICTSFKLDSDILWPELMHGQISGAQLGEKKLPSGEEDFDADDVTLSGIEESFVVERQESLDDIQSEVLDVTPPPPEPVVSSNVTVEQRETISGVELDEKRVMLIELVRDYCDKLVELIKEEALKHVEQISLAENSLEQLNLVNLFQIEQTASSSISTPVAAGVVGSGTAIANENLTMQTSITKNIYTSSMYYNDQQQSFPTIQQQLERSRSIAQQLEADDEAPEAKEVTSRTKASDSSGQSSSQEDMGYIATGHGTINQETGPIVKSLNQHQRARQMFRRRRDRMSRFTLESSDDSTIETINSSYPSNLMASTRPRRASLEPHTQLLSFYNKKQLDGNGGGKDMRDSLAYAIDHQSDCEAANMTDTEYEAPRLRRRPLPARATTTPFGGRTSRLVEMSSGEVEPEAEITTHAGTKSGNSSDLAKSNTKFKPFLDQSTLKDIERLREWAPYGEFNEHNSISPEVCLKLVQDLKSGSSSSSQTVSTLQVPSVVVQPSCDTEDTSDKVRPKSSNRGAQLFERRQLQSSDWIVSSPTIESNQESGTTNGALNKLEDGNPSMSSAVQTNGNSLSRPSLSEETVMVAHERGEQVVELAPIVMSHAQPQLELATITKTPSFSASSWRVIECDSPDVLTSHEEEEEEDEGANMNDENVQGVPHIDDDVAADDDGKQERPSAVVLESNEQCKVDHQALSSEHLVCESRIVPNNSIEWNWMETGASEPQVAQSPVGTTCDHETQWNTLITDAGQPLSPFKASTALRARSQSRSSDLIHQSTLTNWRPQVATPTWMTTEPPPVGDMSPLDFKIRPTSDIIEHHRQIYPVRQSHTSSCSSYVTQCPRVKNIKRQRSRLVSLRENYQNLINESGNNTYRSYRYPFSDSMDARRGRSCSLNKSAETPTPSSIFGKWANSNLAAKPTDPDRQFEAFGIRQCSAEPGISYYGRGNNTSPAETFIERLEEEENGDEFEDKSSYRSPRSHMNRNTLSRNTNPEASFCYTSHPVKQQSTLHSNEAYSMQNSTAKREQTPSWFTREIVAAAGNHTSHSNFRYESPPPQPPKRIDSISEHKSHFSNYSTGRIRDSNHNYEPAATSDQSRQPEEILRGGNWRWRCSQVPDELKMPMRASTVEPRPTRGYCGSSSHHLCSAIEHHRLGSTDREVDENWAQRFNANDMHKRHFPSGVMPLPGQERQEANSSSAARVCCLRVCIKLPNKAHRIVIYRKPRVTFATEIDQ